MDRVLIDTSAWLDFFRNKQGAVGDTVGSLIREDRALLAGPIMTELLHGARGRKERKQLGDLFATIPCLAVEEDDWINTGKMLQKLRRKKTVVPLTNVLIAQLAVRHKIPLLTLDKRFQHLPVECIGI